MRNVRFYGLICSMFAIIPLAPPAMSCATISGNGETVRVVDEAAVIVWDANARIEHFIRRATFHTSAHDFGFLVPTPTQPALAAANDAAFRTLEEVMEPERREEVRRHLDFTPLLLRPFLPEAPPDTLTTEALSKSMPGGAQAIDAVRVLDAERVAGYDVAVLEADNADSLNGWLGAHGYQSGPELADWLAPYVAAHWKITAFKFARHISGQGDTTGDPDTAPMAASAVRLSFYTERPFYPYREPAGQRDANLPFLPRSLRVFLLSTERMDGVIGADASAPKWPGITRWADRLPSQRFEPLAQALGLPTETLSATPYLTVMEDSSSPRPGTDDVFFARAADQSRIVPDPIITYQDVTESLPLDLLTLCCVAPVVLLRMGLKRRTRRLSAV